VLDWGLCFAFGDEVSLYNTRCGSVVGICHNDEKGIGNEIRLEGCSLATVNRPSRCICRRRVFTFNFPLQIVENGHGQAMHRPS
jgi:hypothetical protein